MRSDNDAHSALMALQEYPEEDCKRLLGDDVDCDAAHQAFGFLRDILNQEQRVEHALALTGDRIQSRWPTLGPPRKSALLMLMAARGTARQHQQLGFDPSLLSALAH